MYLKMFQVDELSSVLFCYGFFLGIILLIGFTSLKYSTIHIFVLSVIWYVR
jgi:hypothetical protein